MDGEELPNCGIPELSAPVRLPGSLRLSAGRHVATGEYAGLKVDRCMENPNRFGRKKRSDFEGAGQMSHGSFGREMRIMIPAEHPLRGWSVVHGAWLLNRYHTSSSTGTTAFMSLRGRSYNGRVCVRFWGGFFCTRTSSTKICSSMAQRNVADKGQ